MIHAASNLMRPQESDRTGLLICLPLVQMSYFYDNLLQSAPRRRECLCNNGFSKSAGVFHVFGCGPAPNWQRRNVATSNNCTQQIDRRLTSALPTAIDHSYILGGLATGFDAVHNGSTHASPPALRRVYRCKYIVQCTPESPQVADTSHHTWTDAVTLLANSFLIVFVFFLYIYISIRPYCCCGLQVATHDLLDYPTHTHSVTHMLVVWCFLL